MKAYIFLAGDCSVGRLGGAFGDADLVIAADAGLLTAQKLGVRVDILAGDFDSLAPGDAPDDDALRRRFGLDGGTEIVRVPAVKDDTDASLAFDLALKRGAGEVVFVGGTGGRPDHAMANFFMLERCRRRCRAVSLTDGACRIRCLVGERAEVGECRYFSLLSSGVSVVSEHNCRYPLDRAVLMRDNPYAVSNENLTGERATVEVAGDTCWLIEIFD
jgi:thiamine pyrophosphokinase